MRTLLTVFLTVLCCAAMLPAQTAEELVAKNLQAKGGLEKIKAIQSLHMTGKLRQGSFVAEVGEDAKAPDLLRETFTIQGMTQIQAYDGKVGWQISPFEGRRDPQLLGEDDLRSLEEDADFHGPLVDYQAKGNRIEYLGKDSIEGDGVYKLKVTLKNGDIVYYYLDPDTYLEIRTERQEFIRGAVHETLTDLGSYKLVDGVYYPFMMSTGTKENPGRTKITVEKMEANVPIPDAEFHMPAPPAVASPQTHKEPPVNQQKQKKPPVPKPPAP